MEGMGMCVEERRAVAPQGGRCPRTGMGGCEVLGEEAAQGGGGGEGRGVQEAVDRLLGCRAFLWDVLLEGEWTGCAREQLRVLCAGYGWRALMDAFEER